MKRPEKEIYERLKDFCEVRNAGPCFLNGETLTPRLGWIVGLLEELGIPYELDSWHEGRTRLWNLYVYSVEQRPIVIMAHHDIVNPMSENANDNSASVINAIALRLKRPEVSLVITDGEEVGGLGAKRYAGLVLDGRLPRPVWVLNLELTGRGGKSWFIGDDVEGPLKSYLLSKHGAETVDVPFNDSVVMRRHGIDSCVINPLPKDEHGEFELWRLRRCHSLKDTFAEVSTLEMREFVEQVLVPIVDRWPKRIGVRQRLLGWLLRCTAWVRGRR